MDQSISDWRSIWSSWVRSEHCTSWYDASDRQYFWDCVPVHPADKTWFDKWQNMIWSAQWGRNGHIYNAKGINRHKIRCQQGVLDRPPAVRNPTIANFIPISKWADPQRRVFFVTTQHRRKKRQKNIKVYWTKLPYQVSLNNPQFCWDPERR